MPADPSPGCVDLLVDRHVRDGRAGHDALVECGPAGRRAVSYGQLQRLSIAAAHELDIRLAGSRRQQRIALVGSATLENLAYWLGAMRAGHLPLLAAPALPDDEYDALWQAFDPQLVLADRTARAAGGDAMAPMTALDQLRSPGPAGPPPASAAPLPVSGPAGSLDRRPALVLAAPGTPGPPVLCMHAHRSFREFERSVARRLWGLTAQDRVLASSGPFLPFGLQGVHAPLSLGATAVLLPQWQRHDDLLGTLESERVTVFLAVPALHPRLVSRAARRYRLDALRLALPTGCEPLIHIHPREVLPWT
jgi:acyl-coenzyme A synthetase/AMP-(fatty) acid ligase